MKPQLLHARILGALLSAVPLGVQCGLVLADDASADGSPALEIRLRNSRLYLREITTVTVALLVEPGAMVRNIRYPRLADGSFLVGEFSPPRQRTMVRDGRELVAHEFTATLEPTRVGEIQLGPVELLCDLPGPAAGSGAYFGDSEPRTTTLRSNSPKLSVLPLPARGRPADFTGAVGHFSVARQVVPTTIRAGDPITVTTRIDGVGNIDSYVCQPIPLPEIRSYPTSEKRSANRLTCEQILLPTVAVEIPGAAISFFDPRGGRYLTRRVEPVKVDVLAEPSAAPLPALEAAAQPVDSREFGRGGLIGAAAVTTLIAALLGFFLLGRRRTIGKARVDVVAPAPAVENWLVEAERALAVSDAQRFHLAAFRIAQHLAARPGRPSAGISRVASGPGEGGGGHCMTSLSRRMAEIFEQCDAVRFGRSLPDQDDMQAMLRVLREALGR